MEKKLSNSTLIFDIIHVHVHVQVTCLNTWSPLSQQSMVVIDLERPNAYNLYTYMYIVHINTICYGCVHVCCCCIHHSLTLVTTMALPTLDKSKTQTSKGATFKRYTHVLCNVGRKNVT